MKLTLVSVYYAVSDDMTAEELTRALYPNMMATPGVEINEMDEENMVGHIREVNQV